MTEKPVSPIEDEIKLTLDHLTPQSKGGKNEATNLVTCCSHCNSSRGNRDWKSFAKSVAGYINHGVTTRQIANHVRKTITRPLDTKEAADIIARRGGFSQAVHGQK